MRTEEMVACVGVLGVAASGALGHGEGDIGLLWDGANIVTAVADDESGSFTDFGEFVFGAELSDLGGGFVGADAPGFFTTDGPSNPIGAFDIGTTLSYETVSALRVWNGSDFSEIAGPRLAQDYGGQTVLTPLGDVVTPGFEFAYSGGELDEHPDYGLVDPEPGVFLWEIRFGAVSPTGAPLDTTQSVYVVFNYGIDETIHDEAIEWVELNLPAPGGVGVMLGALGWVGLRRRRR